MDFLREREKGKNVRKHKKKILFEKYQEEHQEALENEKIINQVSEQLREDPETIVVKRESALAGIIRTLSGICWTIFRVLFFAAILTLASIGATTLLNASIRNAFFAALQGYM